MKKFLSLAILLLLLSINIHAADNKCEYLAKAISAEMGEEPFIVRVIYGEMLLNRLYDSAYPDTLPAVCFSLGINVRKAQPTDSDRRAAAAALCNMNFSCGALEVKKVDKKSTPREFPSGVLLYGWYFY